MLVILPLKTPYTDDDSYYGKYYVINHGQPLPVNKTQAGPEHARTQCVATEETIYTTFISALVNTVSNCVLRSPC